MVDLPEEKALALLPDLRDDARIESAYTQIINAIQHKEATLVAYPVVFASNDNRVTAATIDELLYPTEFEPPKVPQNVGSATMNVGHGTATTTTDNNPPPVNLTSPPTNFEKRNVGVSLEVSVTLPLPDKQWFKVDLDVRNVVFLGFDWFEVLKMPTLTSSIQQPEFFTMEISSSLVLRSGQRVLCGMHKLKNPAGQVELFIMQATAMPVGG